MKKSLLLKAFALFFAITWMGMNSILASSLDLDSLDPKGYFDDTISLEMALEYYGIVYQEAKRRAGVRFEDKKDGILRSLKSISASRRSKEANVKKAQNLYEKEIRKIEKQYAKGKRWLEKRYKKHATKKSKVVKKPATRKAPPPQKEKKGSKTTAHSKAGGTRGRHAFLVLCVRTPTAEVKRILSRRRTHGPG